MPKQAKKHWKVTKKTKQTRGLGAKTSKKHWKVTKKTKKTKDSQTMGWSSCQPRRPAQSPAHGLEIFGFFGFFGHLPMFFASFGTLVSGLFGFFGHLPMFFAGFGI